MRKGSYVKKSFESTGKSSDTFASIYGSMMTSIAWNELSATQKVLYLACKSQHYSEGTKHNGDELQFTMNRYKWLKKYKLYSEGNSRGFYRDIEALILNGFITCYHSGKISRTSNIYRFSDKWQRYNEDDFNIDVKDMTYGMVEKLKKKQ